MSALIVSKNFYVLTGIRTMFAAFGGIKSRTPYLLRQATSQWILWFFFVIHGVRGSSLKYNIRVCEYALYILIQSEDGFTEQRYLKKFGGGIRDRNRAKFNIYFIGRNIDGYIVPPEFNIRTYTIQYTYRNLLSTLSTINWCTKIRKKKRKKNISKLVSNSRCPTYWILRRCIIVSHVRISIQEKRWLVLNLF